MEEHLHGLVIADEVEDGLVFPSLEGSQSSPVYDLCLVGTFLTDCSLNFNVMKHRMASSIWRPGRGINIKYLGSQLILFQFYHLIDLRRVMDGGPWSFNSHLLVLHELKSYENLAEVPLYFVSFFIQVYDLPHGFISEIIGKALGDYTGESLEYNEKNNSSFDRSFMRIKALVDVR